MNILKIIGDYLIVPKCGSCRACMIRTEDGLCKKCRTFYLDAKEDYCDFCGMQVSICRCVPQNMLLAGCIDYRKLVFYKPGSGYNPVRSIVYAVKRRYNKPLMKFLARELKELTKGLPADTVVTFPPRTNTSRNKYGYDQASCLARLFAKESGFKYKKLFSRKKVKKGKEQKLLNFRQRAANVSGAFKMRHADFVKGKSIVLIDDVVTSGATLGECVKMLYSFGALNVVCRSIAYTYRKNKQKKD